MSRIAGCLESRWISGLPARLVTDQSTDVSSVPSRVRVLRRTLCLPGKTKKTEALAEVTAQDGLTLFLDVDTRVIGNIDLGFEKAARHGIAIVPAPHYSLADFRGFAKIMDREGVVPKGQIVYNSGVIFFDPGVAGVVDVFKLAMTIASKDSDGAPWGDQTYITLAMEILGFNPYTLSPSFNHRGYGELVSGNVRIWHSDAPVPADAGELEPGYLHRYEKGAMIRVRKVPL